MRMRLWMWFSRVTGIGSVSIFGLMSADNVSAAKDSLHAYSDFVSDPVALYMGSGFLLLAVIAAIGVYLTVRAVERGDHIPPNWLADIDSILTELAPEAAGNSGG